jgi:heat shock protein HslJ
MRKLVVLLALAASAILLVGACSSSSSSTAPSASSASSASGLTGTTWKWTASTTKVPASQSVVPSPDSYTITFNADGTFAGKNDCNQIAGTYTTSGSNGLTIVPGPSTLVACPEGSMDVLYLAGLSATQSYAISGNELTLTLAEEATMTFNS